MPPLDIVTIALANNNYQVAPSANNAEASTNINGLAAAPATNPLESTNNNTVNVNEV